MLSDLSELPDRVLSLSLDLLLVTVSTPTADLSLDTDTRAAATAADTGGGKRKCWPGVPERGPGLGRTPLADQGVVGRGPRPVSGCEVTITCGLDGVELLQLLELESKGGPAAAGPAAGGGRRGRLGLPVLVMFSMKMSRNCCGRPQDGGTLASHCVWHRNLHSLHFSPWKKYSWQKSHRAGLKVFVNL